MSRLYLVDEQTMVREGLRCLLAAAGHAVLGEAADTTVALAEIQRLRPDIVLLDTQLGALSGLPLLDGLRQRGQHDFRAIVVTMAQGPRDIAQAVRAGARGYVLKTAPARQLIAAVEDVAAGRRHFVDGIAERALDAFDDAQGGPSLLSIREQQIVALVVRGASSAEVGEQLHLSPKTIDTYRSRAMAKVGAPHLPALVRWAVRAGLLAIDE